jgi:pyruvate/2-oxoglutarate dehydrogenase complex dihydrolipoamide dehydrogenase (E3) component
MSVIQSPADFDVAVIGGGSGGYAAARTVARAGLRTVVVEGGEDIGGLCILRGCMPTKSLLYAADVMHVVQRSGLWGIDVGAVDFNFSEVMARKNAMVKDFAEYRSRQLTSGKFSFIREMARFQDSHTLQLSNGERLAAKYFIISTGSIVSSPPLPELRQAGYLTSDEALTLTRLPESLIVLGGGAVAVEFAQFFLRFGVKVTLIQRSGHILRDFDTDAALALENVLEREGMKLYHNTKLLGAARRGALKAMSFLCEGKHVEVEAEEILFALGRSANTAKLGLEEVGVVTEQGRVVTDLQMRTNVPHIYAAGDCTGPHEIVHLAIQQGETAARNIAFPQRPSSMDYRLLTNIIFTDPQVASVGLTEMQAQDQRRPYLAASYPFDDHGKSLIMEARDGFVKLLANPTTGEILGGSVVGPMGGELIHEIIAAMHKRMTVHELAVMPHYHPTLAEIWTYPAEELAERIPH